MTAEEDEGVMDYQRLVPMSPISKVIGYLLGLPVREWILFLVTLPFSFWCESYILSSRLVKALTQMLTKKLFMESELLRLRRAPSGPIPVA